jgi:hypothetical protein
MPAVIITDPQAIVDREYKNALCLDNKDDRKELYYLLGKVSPAHRLSFLAWCCAQCQGVLRPKVSVNSTGSDLEVFFDLWALSLHYGLCLDRAAAELERRVSVWTR